MPPKTTKHTTSGRRKNRPSPRERLLTSATRLFTTEGIRVIGIDRILREADVAKASLYSLFGSKDKLVIAYLQALDEQFRATWADRTATMTSPAEKVLDFFDQAIEDEPGKDFRGSYFLNAATEYPRPDTDSERAIVEACREHRDWLHSTMAQHISEALNNQADREEISPDAQAGTLADELLIFLDGGQAGARLVKNTEPLKTARELARRVFEDLDRTRA